MFDLAPEEARLLLDVALLATGRNRFQSAAKILAALERFRPEEPSLPAATAILFISIRDFKGAVDYLDRNALPRFPGAPMLLAFKGMALLRMGLVSDAQAPLLAAANQTADPAAANLAKDLLTWKP